MTFHTCELISGFFDSQIKEKNDIAHLQIHKWFFYSDKWRTKNILHTCKLANDFLNSYKKKKEKFILHISKLTSNWF
jgi:hypothetical protein